jgi:hypothetical protein
VSTILHVVDDADEGSLRVLGQVRTVHEYVLQGEKLDHPDIVPLWIQISHRDPMHRTSVGNVLGRGTAYQVKVAEQQFEQHPDFPILGSVRRAGYVLKDHIKGDSWVFVSVQNAQPAKRGQRDFTTMTASAHVVQAVQPVRLVHDEITNSRLIQSLARIGGEIERRVVLNQVVLIWVHASLAQFVGVGLEYVRVPPSVPKIERVAVG